MKRLVACSMLALAFVAVPRLAGAAQDDCPPGSVEKSEDGFTWCEPTVCLNDSQCSPGYVCVPMALCMEVGVLSEAGAPDGGGRLMARQICAEGTCPQKQTCSDMSRCLLRATAERMKKLPAAAPSSASSSTAGPGAEAKKSSCGCRAVGAPSARDAGLALAGLGVAALVARRRRRR